MRNSLGLTRWGARRGIAITTFSILFLPDHCCPAARQAVLLDSFLSKRRVEWTGQEFENFLRNIGSLEAHANLVGLPWTISDFPRV